jgi:purine catabolism regulator
MHNLTLRAAEAAKQRYTRYGQAAPWFGPTNMEEAQALVERTVQPLIEHDLEHHSALVHTLRVFLAHRRSWQQAARELHVHPQTVLYRVRRIEEINGRDLTETSDLAELWLGFEALDMLTTPGERDQKRTNKKPRRKPSTSGVAAGPE